MGDHRGQFPFQRLFLDRQTGQVLLETLSGDFDVARRVGYGSHVFLSSSTSLVALRPASAVSLTPDAGTGVSCGHHKRSGPGIPVSRPPP